MSTAKSYRQWAEKAEKEAAVILDGDPWWCSPTPELRGPDAIAAHQELELADLRSEWPIEY